jgi:hypothetical protein
MIMRSHLKIADHHLNPRGVELHRKEFQTL